MLRPGTGKAEVLMTELWTPNNIIVEPKPAVLHLRDPFEARMIESFEHLMFEQRWAKTHGMEGPLRLPPIGGAAAGTWTFTNASRTNLLNGTHDIDSDSWKEALFLSTSNIGAASTTYAGVTNEHANNNGYTTGGIAVTLTLSGTTTVTCDSSTDPVWTASGGDIVARFGVLYEVSGSVLAYFLLDSAPANVTATDGNTLTIQHNASGIFTLA